MRTSQFLSITLLLLSVFASCGGGSGGGGGGGNPQEEEDPTTGGTGGGTSGGAAGGTGGGGGAQFNVTVDSEVTAAERTALNSSINLTESMQINGSSVPGFTEVFKGSRSSNVVNYLNSRVNYVISFNTPYDSRYLYEVIGLLSLQDYYGQNPSSYIWYTALANERINGINVDYEISGTPRDINSSHIGVIGLGNIFATPQSSDVVNAITLVHEARHSDCPGGAWASDINRFSVGLQTINAKCGQLHFGFAGSDADPWGPYAIDFIYSKAIEQTCTSCTPEQKSQAQANALDVQSRAYDIQGTVNGAYGPPDLSNSAQVREDL